MDSAVRTRKYLRLLLLLVVMLPIIAACGNTGGETGGTGAGQPAATAEGAATDAAAGGGAPAATGEATGGDAPAAATGAAAGAGGQTATRRLAEPVTIEVFTPVASVELAPPGEDWIVAKIVKEQLNIDLKMSWQTDLAEYDRLVFTRGAANDLPDVFQSSTNLGRDLGAQGLLADWTPFLPSMPTFVQEREIERLAPIGTFDGQLFVLTAKSANPFKQAVSIRQDWLDKLGLEVPKTLDEYMAVMKAFTEQDPDGNGQADTWGYTASVDTSGILQNMDPLWGAFGALGDWRIDNNQLVYVPTSPERRQALEFVNRMVNEGVLDPDWASQKPQDRGNKVRSGRIGIFQEDWCASYCAGNFKPFADANPTGRMVDIAPPVGPDGKSAVSTFTISGQKFSMSQRAVEQGKGEAIALLLEWLTTDGYYWTTYGDEGKHWRREGDKIIAEVTDEARIVQAWKAWSIKGSEEELRARYDVTTEHPNGQTVDVWEIEQRAQQNPKVDITDFAALPPAPAAQAADLARLRAEGELAFANGQRPFSEWDAYVESLNNAGLNDWRTQAETVARESGLLK